MPPMSDTIMQRIDELRAMQAAATREILRLGARALESEALCEYRALVEREMNAWDADTGWTSAP